MKYLKEIIFLHLFVVVQFLQAYGGTPLSIEEMTIEAEYIGIVKILDVNNTTVAMSRIGYGEHIYSTKKKIESNTLFWKIKQIRFALLLYIIIFFAPFFMMGYYYKWRWIGIVFLLYAGLSAWLLSNLSAPLLLSIIFVLPIVSYLSGIILYRKKSGVWRRNKVTEEISNSMISGEDADGSYAIWEYEAPQFSNRILTSMIVLFVVGILLVALSESEDIKHIGVGLVSIMGLILISLIPTLNRIRYRYGCYENGYGSEVIDDRMLFISSASIVAGTADNNSTLAGSGYSSAGSMQKMHKEWSTVQWCKYDDKKRIIYINRGCCKTDKLFCTEKSYDIVKSIAQRATDKILNKNFKKAEKSMEKS
ncbi:MAG: hypothetical protein DRG30_01270 [Epsilonproteobacteria bacterium]|nr:MAG: hypothetical protein DRG30_01270 [Campylobacterota bacterium]